MTYEEASTRLAALAICGEQVPVSCEQCPAFMEGIENKRQRELCNEMLEPEKVVEAVAVVREHRRGESDLRQSGEVSVTGG